MRWIGQSLQRRIESQRDPNQRDRQHLDGDGGTKQNVRKTLDLVFGLHFHLGRSATCNKDDAAGRFFGVRVDAGGEVFRVRHDYWPSSGRAALLRTVAGSLEWA